MCEEVYLGQVYLSRDIVLMLEQTLILGQILAEVSA